MMISHSIIILSLIIFIKGIAAAKTDLYPSVKPSSHIYSLSHDRFKELYLSSYRRFDESQPPRLSLNKSLSLTDLPRRLDWREKGVVSPVKDQKSCGGCWAFSVAETVESRFAIQEHISVAKFSVQEIIDCDPYSNGCLGGNTCSTLKWLSKNSTHLLPESSYPLTDGTESCKLSNYSSKGVSVSQYACLPALSNETDILSHLYYYGPLIAAVDANTWNEYMGGIIQYHCGTQLNHAVQIVGYDRTGDVPYYIVRNSWGTDWGHNGYIYIKIGTNTCGITENINIVGQVKNQQ
ncbi:cathepsin O-like [Watersipora subatra]|uniref:cathepsin O-like n=1 Tax=Watersipora subatra TaxID=2589382 RepID=UPI00355B5CD4